MSNKKGMKRPGGMGGGHMKMGQEKAKDFKGTMKKLISLSLIHISEPTRH